MPGKCVRRWHGRLQERGAVLLRQRKGVWCAAVAASDAAAKESSSLGLGGTVNCGNRAAGFCSVLHSLFRQTPVPTGRFAPTVPVQTCSGCHFRQISLSFPLSCPPLPLCAGCQHKFLQCKRARGLSAMVQSLLAERLVGVRLRRRTARVTVFLGRKTRAAFFCPAPDRKRQGTKRATADWTALVCRGSFRPFFFCPGWRT